MERKVTDYSRWILTTENSVDTPTEHGIEFVSKVLSTDHLDEIRPVLSLISSIGGIVNSHCGLHINFDASKLTLRQILQVGMQWLNFELFLGQYMLPSRRLNANHYCKSNHLLLPLSKYTIVSMSPDRNYKLNL